MKKIVLLRHGESTWNKENRFTGWTDVDLSEKGIAEAKQAGLLLKKEGFVFDSAYTSVLKRAVRTLWIVLDEMDLMWIPVYNSWRLNEKHYGALQGLNKSETALKYGEEQVLRFLPYWHKTIAPVVKSGKRVIISAHGNSLRALVKYLDNIPDEKIVNLNIPTGIPLVYELNNNLKPIKNYYLGDPEAVKKAMETVVNQGKAK